MSIHMSIAKRYTLYTFLVVFFLGAVFTPIMSITSYRREYEKVLDQIHQINHSHIPFLVSSLWMTHYDLLQQQIDSIIQFPYIDRVEITDDEGKLYSRDVDRGTFHRTENLEKHRHVLTYEYRGEEIELGTFTLFINISRLKKDVLRGQTLFLLYQLFLLVVLAATVSLLFHYMIGRHLRSFSDFIRDRGSTSLSLSFSFDRGGRQNNELEQLFGAVNTMRRKLY